MMSIWKSMRKVFIQFSQSTFPRKECDNTSWSTSRIMNFSRKLVGYLMSGHSERPGRGLWAGCKKTSQLKIRAMVRDFTRDLFLIINNSVRGVEDRTVSWEIRFIDLFSLTLCQPEVTARNYVEDAGRVVSRVPTLGGVSPFYTLARRAGWKQREGHWGLQRIYDRWERSTVYASSFSLRGFH